MKVIFLPLLWASCVVAVWAQAASFEGLGQMPGSAKGDGTYAQSISADGKTIIGFAWVCQNGQTACMSTGKTEAFLWRGGSYQVLGDLGSSVGSIAFAASAYGGVIVGEAPKGSHSFGAFRWTAAGGMQALPAVLQYANGVSADGDFVAGGDAWWNSLGQTGKFGPFPGNPDQTQAYGVSGTVTAPIVVGAALKSSDPNGATFHAFRWTPSGGLEDLGLTTGTQSVATFISEDGQVVVGEATDASGFWRAFRWTAATGMQDIGTLGGPESIAYGCSRDGSVVVGSALTSGISDSNDAFRWTAKTGMQSMRGLLDAAGVSSADKWVTVVTAAAVSADGTVIVGFGQGPRSQAFPFGVDTPFRAVLPLE